MRHEGLTLRLLFIIGCGPPSPNSESDSEEVDPLTQACESFCEVAIACSSDEFAKSWKFETTSECIHDCVNFTQGHVDLHDAPECEIVGIELWTCAGEITQCETFESFEDESFSLLGLVENPCRAESETFFQECN
jgi:hypothetical protein